MKPEYTLLLFYLQTVYGEWTLMDELQRLYMRQRFPFRENVFLENVPILSEYDFIVVGSGPAGCAIANRLSEIPQWTILLIEAGQDGNIYNDIPIINAFSVLGTFAKVYDVERDMNVCHGLASKKCYWPSGNGLGGASLINGMIYTRGHPSDFDEWELDGWKYKDILPYFLKSENMSIGGLKDSKYHSTNGQVQVEYPFLSKIGSLFLKAGEELGYGLVDYNNPNIMVGFSQTQTTTRKGKRHSAASAYLLPIKSRPNLHVVKNTFVHKVLLKSNTKNVYGVSFFKKGIERQVMARNEVVLSAGAFGSPKILMLSGIGPANHLNEKGIPVIADLPVGNKLQEHLGTPAVIFLINTTDSYTFPKLLASAAPDFYSWLKGKKGRYSSNGADSLAYIKTKFSTGRPDIELLLFPVSLVSDGGLLFRKTMWISDEVYNKTWKKINFAEAFTIAPMMMYPKSRGQLRLKSKSPDDPLIINANFFSDPNDIKVLIEGIRAAINLTKTNPLQKIGARLYSNPVSGCENFKFNSDKYWECAVKSIPLQFHHQSGTCSMGLDPASSVVNPKLKVHGISGLRVADASVIPTLPGVHTMASCYMIGEKAADMIKEEWPLHRNTSRNK